MIRAQKTNLTNRKRKNRVRLIYVKGAITYSSIVEARPVVDQENCWTKQRFRQCQQGDKEDYHCKLSASCKMRLYILFHIESESVSIWRTDSDHRHQATIPAVRARAGINKTTKGQIDMLFKLGITTAMRIQHVLRERVDPLQPKKFNDDPDVRNNHICADATYKLIWQGNILNIKIK